MKKLTVNKQEELFAQDCKLINLRYEYSGFTGMEKWAIITELSEEALWDKYWNADMVSNGLLAFIVVITLFEIGVTIYKTLRYGVSVKNGINSNT